MITPNRLTVIRVLIAIGTPLFLFWNRSITSEIIGITFFTIACVTDWWDGYLARKYGMVTDFGKITDPLADKLLILGLMVVFCRYGLYSFLWILPIFIREVLVTGTRFFCLSQNRILPAEWAGKLKLGVQIGSIYASFIYLASIDLGVSHSLFLRGAQTLHIFAISLANLVTVFSGVSFYYKLLKK